MTMNIKNFKDFDSSETTNKKTLLTELKQNLIYKNFRKSLDTPIQLPLPFQFSDEFFESKKEQLNHILRTMNFMKLGFEFEIYLPKHIDDGGGYSEEAQTTDLSNYSHNYMRVLQDYFPFNNNKEAYSNIEEDFFEWQYDKIYDDIDARMKDDGIEPDDYDVNRDQYMEDMEQESEYGFDEYIDDKFGGRLLKAAHRFDFYETKYEYGFDDYGDIIIEPGYESENDEEPLEHFEDLADFFSPRIDSPIEVNVIDKDYDTTWYIESDGSVNGNEPNSDYFGVEVMSKKYPASQWRKLFLSTLSIFEEYAEDSISKARPVTNSHTGLHFGVSFDDGRNFNMLKLVVLGQDSFWAKKVNREFNTFCSSQAKDLVRNLENLAKDEHALSYLDQLEKTISSPEKF
jgi:hypothetical protein